MWYALWIMGPLLQVLLAGVMIRRKLRKEFPLFFSYTIFMVGSFVLKFWAYHRSPLEYFYIYWTTGALSIVLGCAVIYEIFQHVFRPYAALRDMGSVLFRWVITVLIVIAVIMAAATPHPETNRILQVILTLERSLRLTQCGLVLFLFLFARYLGVSSRHHMFGIALGFGIFGSLDLLVMTLLAVGAPGMAMVSFAKGAAYNIVILMWLWYLWSPEPARRPARYPIAERWNFAVAGAQHGDDNVMSLLSLENTVDRVMTKSNGKQNGNGHNGNGNGNGNGNANH